MSRLNLCFCLLFSGFMGGQHLQAQVDSILFEPVSEYLFPAPYSAYTARFDRLERPFVYCAAKEYGVTVFDVSTPESIMPVRTFPVQDFQSLKPTDLIQQGNFLYVSLGDFAGLFPQPAGLAVIDVGNPEQAEILGFWSDPGFNKGSAAVSVDGGFAFLGAMEKGVIILNISDPAKPEYVSSVLPDPNWPVPPGIFSVPHARGLALRGPELWTCFDAGGLRLIDISDKKHPSETAKYINTALDAVAQPAYNTALIVDDHLFAAVDYCGLDVVDIGNPLQPKTAAWADPWNCTNTSWDGSPGHTNQVAAACRDSVLFLTGGDSEVLAYAVSDPNMPRRIGQFAVLQDSAVSWGLDVNDSLVVLAQVWNPLNTPYLAKKGGIRLLRWSCPHTSAVSRIPGRAETCTVFPNPFSGMFQVGFSRPPEKNIRWELHDVYGRVALAGEQPAGIFTVDGSRLPAGIYGLSLRSGNRIFNKILVKK